MKNNASILLTTKRNNCIDSIYYGSIYLANKKGIYKTIGFEQKTLFYMRSLAKPLQASIMCDCNIIKDYNFTQKELAIFCASHAGDIEHIKILKNLLKKHDLKIKDIDIIAQEPLDLRHFKGRKTKLHNNCSAKHIMMLLMSKYKGFNLIGYTDEKHPIQQLIKEKQEKLSKQKCNKLSYDGCGTPLWAISAENIIKSYFNLIKNKDFQPILNSILKYPDIYGGYNRFDSEIMQLSKGKLFSKVGAGGFVIIYNLEKDEILLVKMTQNNNEARKLITLDILNKLNWLNTKPVEYELNQKKQKVAKYCYEFKL